MTQREDMSHGETANAETAQGAMAPASDISAGETSASPPSASPPSASPPSASPPSASPPSAGEISAGPTTSSETSAGDFPTGEIILGIDLGTTNSVVAVLRGNQPFVIPVEGDVGTLPSAVGFDANNQLLVGTPARNQALLGPEKTILSVKRRMGEEVRLRLGDEEMSPQEVSAVILRTLKERAEAYLGRSVSKAVITVPAFFKDSQRQATREAGELAGLEVVRIINEPTAAALTYESESGARRRLLVYDLGGGTFDVSIVQIEEGVVEVLSSHGDTRLGGDDFDKLLLDYVADKFAAEHGIDLRQTPTAHSRLRHAAEEAKKLLSFDVFATIDEAFIAESKGSPLNLSITIERSVYEALIDPLVEKTIASVDKALDDAKLYARQIDTVILVGGSTRTPLVQRVVEEKLGQQPLSHVDPDLCVAMGAAIQGGLIQGLDVGPVLVDITPHTLGVRCISHNHGFYTDRYFQEIIARNTALPAARSEIFLTNHPGQEVALFDIYQGENEDATLNEFVGVLRLEGLDTTAVEESELFVRFGLSVNGTLSATAIERATSLEKSVTIDNVISRFRADSREEAKQRLARMFRDDVDAAPAEGVDAETSDRPVKVSRSAVVFEHAQRLLTRAERQLAGATEADRQEIAAIVKRLRHAMEKDDVDAVSTAVEQLDDILFYLQDA